MCAVLLLLLGCGPAARFEPEGTAPGKPKLAHCSPLSCTGCCAGDVCLDGTSDEACGYDGRGCNTCPSTHRCEAPGACYPLPMPATHSPQSVPDDATCYLVDGSLHCQ